MELRGDSEMNTRQNVLISLCLKKGWKSLVKAVHTDGKLGYIQPVGAAPKAAGRDATDVYGVGAFLLAGSELYKLIK